MRRTALVLAVLAYAMPLAWQVLFRGAAPGTIDGLFWFVTSAGSLVLALSLSIVATGLLVAARRDLAQPVLGMSAAARVELVLVAAPAIAVFILLLAVAATLAAA